MARKNILQKSKLKKARAFMQNGDHAGALKLLQGIVSSRTTDSEALALCHTLLSGMGQYEEALALARQMVNIDRRSAKAWLMMAKSCQALGRTKDSLAAYRSALTLDSGNHEAWHTYAKLVADCNGIDDLIPVLEEAVTRFPQDAALQTNLGTALQLAGQLERATAHHRMAVKINPRESLYFENLAAALCAQGQHEASLAVYQEGLHRFSKQARMRSSYLLTLHYADNISSEQLYEAHKTWSEQYHCVTSQSRHFDNIAQSPDRRIRVGYVSPDFRDQSVAYFIAGILRQHDRENIEFVCYSDTMQPDSVTAGLKQHVETWIDSSRMDHNAFCRQVLSDKIDILVDLAGHTAGNRLPAFSQRLAPLQITYLGYPNSTGLDAMDYRIVDALTDPAGFEHNCTEKMLRMPDCFLCYQPDERMPDIGPPPAASNGQITFGSFNNLSKINTSVIKIWSRALEAVPNSRIFLKDRWLGDMSTRRHICDLFARFGIDEGRLIFSPYIENKAEHFSAYQHVDIGLDTFPYNGTTTTCEAMWMGVPVVTLIGDRHASRVGYSLVSATGHPEWAAPTPEDYVKITTELTGNLDKLTNQRLSLRKEMRNSVLCDQHQFTRNLEQTYHELWQAYRRINYN